MDPGKGFKEDQVVFLTVKTVSFKLVVNPFSFNPLSPQERKEEGRKVGSP
jgi:hypothetical protein